MYHSIDMKKELSLTYTAPLLLLGEEITSNSPGTAHARARIELVQLFEQIRGERFPYPILTKRGKPIPLKGEAAERFEEWKEEFLRVTEIPAYRPDDHEHCVSIGTRFYKALNRGLEIYTVQAEESVVRQAAAELKRETRRAVPKEESYILPTLDVAAQVHNPQLSKFIQSVADKQVAAKKEGKPLTLTRQERADYEILAKYVTPHLEALLKGKNYFSAETVATAPTAPPTNIAAAKGAKPGDHSRG